MHVSMEVRERMQRLLSLGLSPWFVLGWVLLIGVGDSFPLKAVFIILLFMHLSFYVVGFAVNLQRRFQHLLVIVQACLVFALGWVAQDLSAALFLSLAWMVVAVKTFKRGHALQVAIGGYLALLCLYVYVLGTVTQWRGNPDLGAYFSILTIFLASLSLGLYLQQRRAYQQTQVLLHDLDVAHAQLSAYALRVEELTTQAERQRLARELHDTLSQGLVGLLMQLDAANSYFDKEHYPKGRAIVAHAMERARTMLDETRYVISDLRTANSMHPDDLPELAQEEIERFTIATSIPCQASLDALTMAPAHSCEQVLRVISEGLTNIARHARAHQVWVCATARTDILEVEIGDDGTGFDPASVINLAGHYGLR